MADEKQDDEELIIIETPPEGETAPAPAEEAEAKDDRLSGAEDDDQDDDDGDDDHDDASDKAITVKSHKRRRLRQKRGREQSQQEIEALRTQVAQMAQILQGVQGSQFQASEQSIDARLTQAQADAREAETIMAQAVSDGDGARVAEALRIRDAAREEAMRLAQQKQHFAQARQPQPQRGPDPQVQSLASQWLRANAEWYDPSANDPQSSRVKQIDAQVARDGYNPATQAYWQELTRRCQAEMGSDDPEPAPRRKAPPTGTTREHAPASTRNEVYVTPERKAAIVAAGMWDDPVQRTAMLKYYQQYDRENVR